MSGNPTGAVLFDIDGTLVDNSYLHTVAWWRALRRFDVDVPMRRIHRLIGMGGDKLTAELCGAERADISDAHAEEYEAFLPEIRALPGTPELLRACSARGLEVLLASSARQEQLERLLRAIMARDVLDGVIASGDVSETKPAPDIFAVATERAGVPAERCIAVGDTGWDVEAAARAGLECIALRSGGWSDDELRAAGAVAVYEDCEELLRELPASPIGRLGAG